MGRVMAVAEASNIFCPFAQCSADFIQITLFFCLRLCEHTKTNSHRRTVQFCLKDLQFHDADGVIPLDAFSKIFLCSRAVTLLLDTQKNSVW